MLSPQAPQRISVPLRERKQRHRVKTARLVRQAPEALAGRAARPAAAGAVDRHRVAAALAVAASVVRAEAAAVRVSR